MKQIPLLMSGPLVREILAGNKSQTRRPVKGILNENPSNFRLTTSELITMLVDGYTFPHFEFEDIRNGHILCVPSQYGIPGDGLWVRETWKWEGETSWKDIDPVGMFFYRADPDSEDIRNWKPSIFMPKTASRITLDILEIGVERLHEISEEDAKAEGVEPDRLLGYGKIGEKSYREGFFRKWYEIYDLASFTSNPWVWKIRFKRIEE